MCACRQIVECYIVNQTDVYNRSISLSRSKTVQQQWRQQGHWGKSPSTSNDLIFGSFWSKFDNQLSKCCVVCEISWCRCQQLTALSISTALVTKLLVIEQLLQPALKSTVSDLISSLVPPRNKSWRRHCSTGTIKPTLVILHLTYRICD